MTSTQDSLKTTELMAPLTGAPTASARCFTIGYGGRRPGELIALLCSRHIATVVDCRLRPDRAVMGTYVNAKSREKGIAKLLSDASIGYVSLIELGNLFVDLEDWEPRYRRLLDAAGDLLIERLIGLPEPLCLLCCEKSPFQCHRRLIADFLARRGWTVEHLL